MTKKIAPICRVRITTNSNTNTDAKNRPPEVITYIDRECFVIGHSQEADVHVAGSGIIGHHLLVKVTQSGVTLEDLGSTHGTSVSGQPVPMTPTSYTPGEAIRLGQADHLVTLDLFAPVREPKEEAAEILNEARDRAAEIEREIADKRAEIDREIAAARDSIAKREADSRAEITRKIEAAHQTIEEKNRKAIEDRHVITENFEREARVEAEALLRQKQEEGEEILSRAKSVAGELIASARDEVQRLLTEAREKAEATVKEGIERRDEAHRTAEGLKNEIATLGTEYERARRETDEAKSAADETIQRKQMLVRQTEQTEAEAAQARESFAALKSELEEKISQTKDKLASAEEQVKGALGRLEENRAQIEAGEKRLAELQGQCQKAKSEFQKRNAQSHALANDIKQAEAKREHWTAEIGKLEALHASELSALRAKVDAEYARQLLTHETHFRELRERENLALLDMQRRFEAHEQGLLQNRVAHLHDRLWHLISDRAALYGVAKLKENEDFRNDLRGSIEQGINEEFEFRRRELATLVRPPHLLLRRERRKQATARYAGWLVSLGLLALLIYGQMAGQHETPDLRMTRGISSVPESVPSDGASLRDRETAQGK